MIRDGSEDTRECFLRHLRRDVEYQPHAIYRADMLISELLLKGKGRDWSEEDDRWANATKADDTRLIDPEGVAGTGKWAVSTSHNTLSRPLLTRLAKYWGNVGEGGNGRAVLYLKLHASGRILQVSTHSIVI